MDTLDFEIATAQTLRDTRRQIAECVVELENTRELKYSCNGGSFNELVVHSYDEFGEPQLANGDFRIYPNASFTDGCTLSIVSDDPVSCNVLSRVPEVDHGDL